MLETFYDGIWGHSQTDTRIPHSTCTGSAHNHRVIRAAHAFVYIFFPLLHLLPAACLGHDRYFHTCTYTHTHTWHAYRTRSSRGERWWHFTANETMSSYGNTGTHFACFTTALLVVHKYKCWLKTRGQHRYIFPEDKKGTKARLQVLALPSPKKKNEKSKQRFVLALSSTCYFTSTEVLATCRRLVRASRSS